MTDEYGPWITHNGAYCPCEGKYAQVKFDDGDTEEGIAHNHIYWRYVTQYRIRKPKD